MGGLLARCIKKGFFGLQRLKSCPVHTPGKKRVGFVARFSFFFASSARLPGLYVLVRAFLLLQLPARHLNAAYKTTQEL